MAKWLSDEDMDRIARFAESPGYTQTPTMLLPDESDEDTEDDSSE